MVELHVVKPLDPSSKLFCTGKGKKKEVAGQASHMLTGHPSRVTVNGSNSKALVLLFRAMLQVELASLFGCTEMQRHLMGGWGPDLASLGAGPGPGPGPRLSDPVQSSSSQRVLCLEVQCFGLPQRRAQVPPQPPHPSHAMPFPRATYNVAVLVPYLQ